MINKSNVGSFPSSITLTQLFVFHLCRDSILVSPNSCRSCRLDVFLSTQTLLLQNMIILLNWWKQPSSLQNSFHRNSLTPFLINSSLHLVIPCCWPCFCLGHLQVNSSFSFPALVVKLWRAQIKSFKSSKHGGYSSNVRLAVNSDIKFNDNFVWDC